MRAPVKPQTVENHARDGQQDGDVLFMFVRCINLVNFAVSLLIRVDLM